MKVELRYQFMEQVLIVPLELLRARIVDTSVGEGGIIQYKARYFNNGEEKSCWFFEDELRPNA